MEAVFTRAEVSVITFDRDCNVKECLNCSDEVVKYAVEKCRELKRG